MSTTPVYAALVEAGVGTRGAVWLDNGEVLRGEIAAIAKGLLVLTAYREVASYTATAATDKAVNWPLAAKTFIAIDSICRFGRPPWA